MKLKVSGLELAYGEISILSHIELEIDSGHVIALVGPNGSGKTTLLRAISGLIKPNKGAILLDGKALRQMHPAEIAQQMASIEQEILCAFEITVREAVALGRLPYLRRLANISQKDYRVIESAMQETGITPFANRPVHSLSSGERQRVWIAMALAQEPKVLLLDEPTSHLDIKYQIEIMELVRHMADRGLTVILSLHDLNLAAHYSDRVALLANRELLMFGRPSEVMTEALIEQAFGTKIQIVQDNQGELFLLPQLNESSQLLSVLKEV